MNTLSSLLMFIGGRINVDYHHPVGSYYQTSDGTFDPNTTWGGTWSLLGEGQVLLSGSSSGTYRVGSQYGANTKGIAIANLPNHAHSLSQHAHDMSHTHGTGSTSGYGNFVVSSGNVGNDAGSISGSGYNYPQANSSNGFNQKASTGQPSTNATGLSGGGSTGGTGSGTAFNVMQASTAVYIWHRTA